MESPKTKLFVDMDGTLAMFYADPLALAHYRAPGYFLSLKPYAELVEALKRLRAEKDLEVIVLSAVDPDCRIPATREKTVWLKTAFDGNPPSAIFPDTGTRKSDALVTDLDRNCWLLDDYSKNLAEWEQDGGRSIKALNEINGNGLKWHGRRLPVFGNSADSIYNSLVKTLGL